jgi:hypothetical protein
MSHVYGALPHLGCGASLPRYSYAKLVRRRDLPQGPPSTVPIIRTPSRTQQP